MYRNGQICKVMNDSILMPRCGGIYDVSCHTYLIPVLMNPKLEKELILLLKKYNKIESKDDIPTI